MLEHAAQILVFQTSNIPPFQKNIIRIFLMPEAVEASGFLFYRISSTRVPDNLEKQ
jgi:hypothetical protein